MGKLGKFIRSSGTERLLFLEAVSWCALVRLTMLLLPFRKYTTLLGTPVTPGSVKPPASRSKQQKKLSINTEPVVLVHVF